MEMNFVHNEYVCDAGCGFYKNDNESEGAPCRRIDCDGTVRQVRYYHESTVRELEAQRDALAKELYDAMTRSLRELKVNEDQYVPAMESHIQSIIDNAKPKENNV